MSAFDVRKVREDFPILTRKVHGKDLVYLDNAATTQKPKSVIEALTQYYTTYNANVHRGAYLLSQEATDAYEGVRPKVARFIGAEIEQEIIFTRGTTESLNMIAACYARDRIQSGDDIVVTRMEHHSSFVPWQQLAKEKGANFKIVELDSDFRLDLDSLDQQLSGRPKILAVTLMSNVLGTINPIREIAERAKKKGAVVVVDAAQAAAQIPIRISELGPIDFLAFSSHKVCGPTGVGVLWGRETLLKEMRPWQYGGDMILRVQDQDTTWNQLPWKFEAGTPNIAGIIAFGTAIDYLESIGMDTIRAHEKSLAEYALTQMQTVPGLKIVGPRTLENRGSTVSFVLEGVHPHDLATFLDMDGIATRAGHHCAQPLMSKLGIVATSRASFLFYNTQSEIDIFVESLKKAQKYFGR